MDKDVPKIRTSDATKTYIGIHLSGSNSPKTSVVVLQDRATHRLVVEGVYEKIASYGSLFSDERLVDIVSLEGPVPYVFIDAPLTASPCEMCVRDLCPGALRCDDLAVAYLLKLSQEGRALGKKRKRSLNPQSQRLWDVAYSLEATFEGVETSFNTNKAPLVVRARSLAKRLQALSPSVRLKETSVPHTLASFASAHGTLQRACRNYRSFEGGQSYRKEIIAFLLKTGWLEWNQTKQKLQELYCSVENFHAFIGALVAYMHDCRLTGEPPDEVYKQQGWVYVPREWPQDRL